MRGQRWASTATGVAVTRSKYSCDLSARRASELMKIAFAHVQIWEVPRRLTSAPPALCDRLRGVTWTGNPLVGCFVGGLGGRSTLAPLRSCATAVVTVE